MKTKTRTLEEIQQAAFDALVRELGLADATRFFQAMSNGTGDYTKERYDLLGDDDVDTIAARIMAKQAKNKSREA